jgi:quercetin dioxygenase-like cupin family protein
MTNKDISMKPVSWDEISEEKVGENLTRKMIWGEKIMMVRVELPPRAELPMHDHVSEQLTVIESGSILMKFPDGSETLLKKGDMLVIPSSKPHAVTAGPEGSVSLDLFSPIREDFISGKVQQAHADPTDPYQQLHGFLRSKGVKATVDQLRELPLEALARYTYEKECITMGQLREILGIDKTKARALLRQWKHGDDHSESSYKRKFERMIVLPAEIAYTVDSVEKK